MRDDYVDSIDASLDHIRRVAQRRKSLEQAQVAAEEQVCHRIGSAYRAGDIDIADLAEYFIAYREDALPYFTKRWDAAVPITARKLLTYRGGSWTSLSPLARPNGPNGMFCGAGRPAPSEPAPPRGMSVVYVLYDAMNVPAYVGSTMHFRSRIKQHMRAGKPVDYWTATPCANRRAAYELETRLLKEVMPYLNKRASA